MCFHASELLVYLNREVDIKHFHYNHKLWKGEIFVKFPPKSKFNGIGFSVSKTEVFMLKKNRCIISFFKSGNIIITVVKEVRQQYKTQIPVLYIAYTQVIEYENCTQFEKVWNQFRCYDCTSLIFRIAMSWTKKFFFSAGYALYTVISKTVWIRWWCSGHKWWVPSRT